MNLDDLDTMTLDELQNFETQLIDAEKQSRFKSEYAGYPESSLTASPEKGTMRKIGEGILGLLPGGALAKEALGEEKLSPGEHQKAKMSTALDIALLPLLGGFGIRGALTGLKTASPSIRQSDKLAGMLQKAFSKTAIRGKGGYVKQGVEKTTSMRELPGPEPPFRPQIAAESGWTDILGPGWTDIPGPPQIRGYLPPASPTRMPTTVEQLRRGVGFRENLNLVEQLLSMGEGI